MLHHFARGEGIVVLFVIIILIGAWLRSCIDLGRVKKLINDVEAGADRSATNVHPFFAIYADRLERRREGGVDAAELEEALNVVEDAFEEHLGFARFLAASAVYAGLFGTLLGLTVAVQGLSSSIPVNTTSWDLAEFLKISQTTLSGFSVAFSSALAGVLVTVGLSFQVGRVESRVGKCKQTLAQYALTKYPSSAMSHRQQTPQEFAAQLVDSLSSVDQSLVLLLEAVQKSNEQQSEMVTSYKQLVEASVKSFAHVAEAAVSEFRERLAEQTEAYQVIRDTIRESATDATAQLSAVANVTRAASDEIKEAIAAAQREREETEKSILGLGQAAQTIQDATALMTTNLKAAGELSKVVADASQALKALSTLSQQALSDVVGQARDNQKEFERLLKDHQKENQENVHQLADAVERHQEFAELVMAEITSLPTTVEAGRYLITADDQFQHVLSAVAELKAIALMRREQPSLEPAHSSDGLLLEMRRMEERIKSSVDSLRKKSLRERIFSRRSRR